MASQLRLMVRVDRGLTGAKCCEEIRPVDFDDRGTGESSRRAPGDTQYDLYPA